MVFFDDCMFLGNDLIVFLMIDCNIFLEGVVGRKDWRREILLVKEVWFLGWVEGDEGVYDLVVWV